MMTIADETDVVELLQTRVVEEERTVERMAREILSLDLDADGRAVPRTRRAERESTYNATRARLRWEQGHRMTPAAFLAALVDTRAIQI